MRRISPIAIILVLAGAGFGQWEPDIRLSFTTDPSETPMNGRGIAASGSGVHVVWTDGVDPWGFDLPEIYYARSADSGATWEPQHRLTTDPEASDEPCVAAESPDVYVAWQDSRVVPTGIFLKHSTDDGATWSADRQAGGATGTSPALCVAGPVLHLAYIDWRSGRTDL